MTKRTQFNLIRNADRQRDRNISYQEALGAEVAGVNNSSGRVIIRRPGSTQGLQSDADSSQLSPLPGSTVQAQRLDVNQGGRKIVASYQSKQPGALKVKAVGKTVYPKPQPEPEEAGICRTDVIIERPEPDCCGITGFWTVKGHIIPPGFTWYKVYLTTSTYGGEATDTDGCPISINGADVTYFSQEVPAIRPLTLAYTVTVAGSSSDPCKGITSEFPVYRNFYRSLDYADQVFIEEYFSDEYDVTLPGGYRVAVSVSVEEDRFEASDPPIPFSTDILGNHTLPPYFRDTPAYYRLYTLDCLGVEELGAWTYDYNQGNPARVEITEVFFTPDPEKADCFPEGKPGGDEPWVQGEDVR